ncbi:MAG: ROK family protein [Proteobacteria bacterium]|nr:ROK family protein [Pseudomonadota bacterium]
MHIGIDLGGTKTEIAAFDPKGGERLRRRAPTPASDYSAIVDLVARLVDEAERELGEVASVGVATPGTVSPATGVMKNANTQCLNGKPLKQDLERVLSRPIRLANDANCFALSEAVDGAGAGARVVFGVILGTGVGGGIVVNGKLVVGINAICGEWGHNALPWPRAGESAGEACYCGLSGCIETFLSGPGMSRDHYSKTQQQRSAAEIAELARRGDAHAKATLGRYEDRLARALALVVNILDPDAIVLGGGLSNIQRLYREVPLLLPRHVFSDRVHTPLLPAVHGDSGGVRGAAWLW